MAARPGKNPRSALRPMVVGAAVLGVVVATGSVVLALWGPHAVAEAVAAEAGRHAAEEAWNDTQIASLHASQRLATLIRRTQQAADRVAAAAARPPDGPPSEAPELDRIEGSALMWMPPSADGSYAVATSDDPPPEARSALAGDARRIGPHVGAALDPAAGIVHAAVWFRGVGLVGAASPEVLGSLGARSLAAGFDASALAHPVPVAAAWQPLGRRLAGEPVVSYVVPVEPESGTAGIAAMVTVDLSLDAVARVLPVRDGQRDPLVAIVAWDGSLLASTPGFLQRAGIPDSAAGDGREIEAELRRLLGDDRFRDAPAEGTSFRSARRIASGAAVPGVPWTVVALGPHEAEVVSVARSESSAEDAARRQAYGFLALAILFGGSVALGALALAHSFVRRLRPILAGAAAHARGDLSHMIPVDGDDDVGELAASLNSTATRLRRNLVRLQEGERRLQGLIESMGEGFIIADAEDRITFANARVAEMLKRPRAALLGRYVEELLLPESVEAYRAETSRRRTGRSGQYEVSWRVYGGRHPRAIVSGMPNYDTEGRYCGSFAVVTDVTDRSYAQEESARAEKLRALGEMAGGVAHDFNNLLTVILGNAQFLLAEDLPEDVKTTLRAIEQSAFEGTDRVRRVTEFTKTRGLPLYSIEIDPNALAREALDAARARHGPAAAARGAAFEVELNCESRRSLFGNPYELRDALLNVLDNAFESMPGGGRLTVETFDRGEDSVGLRIEDTGRGMDEDVRAKCFDPFFTTKQAGRCAGLGLSIAFGIVRAHGGRIDLKSLPGKGSTLTIVVPAWSAAAAAARQAPPEQAPPPRPRVLLVGADLREVEATQRGLRELGVYVATVTSPQAAAAMLPDTGIFNTLVVDQDLGDTTGWALAREARSQREDLRIVLVTGPGRDVDETQARNAGIDRVLPRPFVPRDLHALVFSLLVTPPARRVPGGAAPAPAVAPVAVPAVASDEGRFEGDA